MSLEDIYNLIHNPISVENISELLHALANSSSVYNALLGGRNSEKINRKNNEELQIKLAESWRRDLAAMSDEEIKEKENRTPNFSTLPINCRSMPIIKSFNEAISLLSQIPEGYAWSFKNGGWEYFQSTDLIGEVKIKCNMNTRIYINCSLDSIGEFIEEIIVKCRVAEIPVFLKTLMNDTKRRDRILLWSDSKNIDKYLSVLKEILIEHPEWQMDEPPILTGKVLNGVGIASEPNEAQQASRSLGDEHSFNSLRAQIILETTESMLKLAFAQIPLEKPYNISNKFFKYLSEEISKGLRIQSIYLSTEQVYKQITSNKEYIRTLAEKIGSNDTGNAAIFFGTKEYSFTQDINQAMKRCLPYIDDDLNGFNTEYVRELKKRLSDLGIDSEKICFNSNTLDEFRKIDSINNDVNKSGFSV